MKFFYKCLAVFVSLSILFTLTGELLLQTSLPISGNLLFGTFAALILTILYGWIDDVYIHQRQPDSNEF